MARVQDKTGDYESPFVPLPECARVQCECRVMKDDPDFNPPAEMVARAMFLFTHAALAGGIVLTVAGVLTLQLALAGAGVAALVATWMGRIWLRAREHEIPDQALETLFEGSPPLDEARVAELIELLERWEALEEKRGSPGFDPWAVQALRHDIRVVVESDPALEQLFSRLRSAA